MSDGIFAILVSLLAAGPAATYAGAPDEAGPLLWERPRAEVVQPYKDGGRYVGNPVLDTRLADGQCPNGWSVRREEKRIEGTRENLVWILNCR